VDDCLHVVHVEIQGNHVQHFDSFGTRRALERLTKPFDIPPTDERASERKERLMDVCSPLMPDAQSAKAV
jgi:hypothetical protein